LEAQEKPRNIGSEKLKRRLYRFLDADDIWKEEKLEVQLDLWSKRVITLQAPIF